LPAPKNPPTITNRIDFAIQITLSEDHSSVFSYRLQPMSSLLSTRMGLVDTESCLPP
jgi:hypothetical protein